MFRCKPMRQRWRRRERSARGPFFVGARPGSRGSCTVETYSFSTRGRGGGKKKREPPPLGGARQQYNIIARHKITTTGNNNADNNNNNNNKRRYHGRTPSHRVITAAVRFFERACTSVGRRATVYVRRCVSVRASVLLRSTQYPLSTFPAVLGRYTRTVPRRLPTAVSHFAHSHRSVVVHTHPRPTSQRSSSPWRRTRSAIETRAHHTFVRVSSAVRPLSE